nr:anterior gradient protein 3 isoform X1 [Microcebus murinus]
MLLFLCRRGCRSGVFVSINPHPFSTRNIQSTLPTSSLASSGWGDDITWVQTYEEGLFHAQKSNKPLMVIHHLEDCQYCQALKKVFAQDEEIQELAQNNFIMLNLMHETTDKNLSPDGQYVPRIMFVDPSLTVRADITGRYSNRLYTYEPQDLPVLIENMKKALRLIQSEL